jgi:hypothetical protein
MKHLSEEEISRWVAGEGEADSERHLRECASCAGEVAQTQAALRMFRDSGYRCAEYWQAQSPAQSPARHSRRLWKPLVGAVAVAAAVVIAFTLRRAPEPEPRKEVFVEIPYVVPAASYERTSIVRMNVPVAALIAAGFEVRAESPESSVSADVLLGQDGRALAVSLGGMNQ